MKLQIIHWIKAPKRSASIQKKRSVNKIRQQMLLIKVALSQEKAETIEMLSVYRRFTMQQASAEELKIANQQFVNLLKGLGLGVFAVLPFSPITIPLAIKLGRKVGVEILPSTFQRPKS